MINLSIPNKILNQLSKQNKYITPVTVDDLPLFQRFFKKEKCTYGNSWTYVTQGVYGLGPNNLGYKYYDGKNLSIIGIYPKLEKPELNVFYWVRPMGPTVLDVITDFSGQLLAKDSLPTYVKKIFKEQFDYLEKKGFKDTKNFPWHRDFISEDDSYPEIIIDVKKTLNNFNNSRAIKNAFKRYNSLSEKIIVTKIDSMELKNIGWKLAEKFFKQELKTLDSNISSRFDFYNPIFNSINDEVYILTFGGKPKGIFDICKLEDGYYSSYMALMLREELTNLNEFSILFSCIQIDKEKGHFLNLGGSETEGLHNFKNKFVVSKQIQMYWAVLN